MINTLLERGSAAKSRDNYMKSEMPVATVILQHRTCTRRCFRRPFSCWGAVYVALCVCVCVCVDRRAAVWTPGELWKRLSSATTVLQRGTRQETEATFWMRVTANYCLKESWQAAEGRRVRRCTQEYQGLKNGHAAQRRLHFTSKLFPQPRIDSATITQVHKLLLMEHTKAQHRQETDMC